MTIPRELRDQICTYFICGQTAKPPPLEQTFEQLIESRAVRKNPKLRAWSALVLAPSEASTPNATTLMLVNRQLYGETRQNIKLLKQLATYDLDVIILDEILPLTTWTSVPFHTKVLDQVNTTFRISGSYDYMKDKYGSEDGGPYRQFNHYKGWRGGCGAGPAMTWQTYSILERFIRCGTAGDEVANDEHQHITVKHLNINIETPPHIDPARFTLHPRSRNYYREPKNPERDTLDPACMTRFIEGHLGGLLGGGSAEWFSYGKILFEHVNRITVSQDGVETRSFDVAEMLRDAGGFQEKYLTQVALDEYKNWAWEWRKEKELKVLDS